MILLQKLLKWITEDFNQNQSKIKLYGQKKLY